MDHRAAVGPARHYGLIGALQFMLMVMLGMHEESTLLDIGCGSLRGGKFFIHYLGIGKYYGIEPNKELVLAGVGSELRWECDIDYVPKQPHFYISDKFDLTKFGVEFDYLLAQSIFTHADREQIGICLQQAYEVMHSRSVFAATFMLGDDYAGTGWCGNGNVASYNKSTVVRVIDTAKLYHRFIPFFHPSGQQWVIMARSGNHLDKVLYGINNKLWRRNDNA